jgi:ADP-ribosylglycohydrolase
MLGAIIGDIIGSPYEFNNVNDKVFELFTKCSHITDDTVMSVAVADCLLRTKDLEQISNVDVFLGTYGKQYLYAGYGKKFKEWILSSDKKPYESYGNGAAMRVSAIPYLCDDIEGCQKIAEQITNVTHNCEQSVRAAKAVVSAMHMALYTTLSKEAIRTYLESSFGYNLRKYKMEDLTGECKFDVSCDGTIPRAFAAFFEGTDYEDTIRNAVSIGGDSDTIACIAGGMAEAYHKHIPYTIMAQALPLIPEELLDVVDRVRLKHSKNTK